MGLTFLVPYLVSTFSSVLAKLSLIPGDVANQTVKASCIRCNQKDCSVVKGEWVPFCPVCGDNPEITELRDEEQKACDLKNH